MNEYGVDGLACSELVQGNATLKIDIEQTTTPLRAKMEVHL